MKAAVYYHPGPPAVFQYEDVADPVCAPDGVVIEVEAISIEGGDVGNRARGEMPRVPHVVGYQCGGTIREVGAQVGDRKVGDRIVAVGMNGSHAERVAAPSRFTFAIPDGLETEVAACIPIAFGTADDCLFEFGHLKAGETVLIQAGAGGVGLAAIQLAKRAGATVIATASNPQKLARLRDEFGLDHGIDYRARKFFDAVQEITGGRGCDLVVDSVGGATLQWSIESLAYRGRCIAVGNASRDDTRPDVRALAPGNRSLTGVFLGAELAFNHGRVRPLIERHMADVAAGKLRVVIDSRYPLAKAADAHARVEGREAFGRVVLLP